MNAASPPTRRQLDPWESPAIAALLPVSPRRADNDRVAASDGDFHGRRMPLPGGEDSGAGASPSHGYTFEDDAASVAAGDKEQHLHDQLASLALFKSMGDDASTASTVEELTVSVVAVLGGTPGAMMTVSGGTVLECEDEQEPKPMRGTLDAAQLTRMSFCKQVFDAAADVRSVWLLARCFVVSILHPVLVLAAAFVDGRRRHRAAIGVCACGVCGGASYRRLPAMDA